MLVWWWSSPQRSLSFASPSSAPAPGSPSSAPGPRRARQSTPAPEKGKGRFLSARPGLPGDARQAAAPPGWPWPRPPPVMALQERPCAAAAARGFAVPGFKEAIPAVRAGAAPARATTRRTRSDGLPALESAGGRGSPMAAVGDLGVGNERVLGGGR
ncbi:hypothetical protein PVAP13_7NG123117 [Panicum virgatum]|uniref:Uncharacterized protein n=1 Tax=Panicum virgatum TaxID=38727 RepID=A0A8T0PXH5_PANVG|nr:hypothetical protein PVAP13_7NG123117 [Panicum virgatum]